MGGKSNSMKIVISSNTEVLRPCASVSRGESLSRLQADLTDVL